MLLLNDSTQPAAGFSWDKKSQSISGTDEGGLGTVSGLGARLGHQESASPCVGGRNPIFITLQKEGGCNYAWPPKQLQT